jgi:hypothetical protein
MPEPDLCNSPSFNNAAGPRVQETSTTTDTLSKCRQREPVIRLKVIRAEISFHIRRSRVDRIEGNADTYEGLPASIFLGGVASVTGVNVDFSR